MGIYSVKTAYHALVTQKERSTRDEGAVTGTSTTEEQMWKTLWKLNVMPKVRIFWWRVLRGILPDEATLKHRHIKPLSICKVCLAGEEDLEHALIHCSHAKLFWDEAHDRLDIRLPRLHPQTWSRDILCEPRFSDGDRSKIILVMWSIWHSRNRWTHDDEGYNLAIAVKHIRESLALLEIPCRHTKVLPGYGWRPPDGGVIKINVDGAINSVAAVGGAGGVARSATALLGAWSRSYAGVTDPLIMEALSLRDAVRFASLWGF